MQCGLCGGEVSVDWADEIDPSHPMDHELYRCSGCGAESIVDYYGDMLPAWIYAPPSRVFTRCLKVYDRNGRRIRAPDERGSCYSWEVT